MSPPSGGSFRGGFLSPPHTPNSPIFAASDRLPCISPSELIGPFVGSFQESILSGEWYSIQLNTKMFFLLIR